MSVVSDVELMRDRCSLIAESVGFGLPFTDENSPGIPDQEGEWPTQNSVLSKIRSMSMWMLKSGKEEIGRSRSADAKVRGADCRSLAIAGIRSCQCLFHGPHRFLPSVLI